MINKFNSANPQRERFRCSEQLDLLLLKKVIKLQCFPFPDERKQDRIGRERERESIRVEVRGKWIWRQENHQEPSNGVRADR